MSRSLLFNKTTSPLACRFGAVCTLALALVSIALAGQAHSAQVTVAWDPASTQVAGYKLYYGLSTGNYTNSIDAGTNTSCALKGLSNSTYFIAATAYDSNNSESDFSQELVIYPMTVSAGSGGSISPSGTLFQSQGANQTFNIVPDANHKILDVLVDGQSVGAVGSYTISGVSAPHSIAAAFIANAASHTITATSGSNGSISPAAAVTVNSGASRTFSIAANANYRVCDVKVDGVSVGAVANYTFANVRANHTISASFALNTYTITPTAQASGSISPAAAVTVNSGASRTFSIAANANYRVSDVKVDGVSVGAVASYTFANVRANHTISASFAISAQSSFADAGPDQTVALGSMVRLNGANSTDQDGQIVSYLWTQISGQAAVAISNRSAASATFKAPSVGPGGTALVFMLTVTDNNGLKATDTCIVNVTLINQPPVADAGPEQAVSPWTIVTLDGSKSTDLEDSSLSYLWEQTDGAPVTLSKSDVPQPNFIAPESLSGSASLTFRLTVSDTFGLKSRSTCTVNVISRHAAPHADVGPNQTVSSGEVASLNGSGTPDPASAIASVRWHQTGGSPVTFSDPKVLLPTFVAPTYAGDSNPLTFRFTVTDHAGLQSGATQTVTVKYAGPDLAGKWTSFNYKNGTIIGTLQISNAGNQSTAGRFNIVSFYLSGDGITLDKLLSKGTVGPLNAGQSQALQFSYEGIGLSGKYIIALIDSAYSIVETGEMNNVAKALIH